MGAIKADPTGDILLFGWQALQAAFGLNGATGREQALGSVVFGTLAYVSTLLSFGATAVLVVLAALLFAIGVFRIGLRLVID
jgi:hypothetical protein